VDFVTVTGFRGFREFRFLGRPLTKCCCKWLRKFRYSAE